MTRIRAGIIGMGVGEQHIAGYQSHPACEVVALCDVAEEKCRLLREKYPSMAVHREDSAILEDPDIHVVSIASYDCDHYDQIVRAIQQDKHVFVEKPLCLYEHQARHIRQLLSERPHLQLSSNLILRKSPRFVELRALVEQGALGRLYHVEGDYNYGRIHKITEGWRGRIDFYSVVYGGGVHIIDLLLWLTGERVVEVAAYGNNLSTQGTRFRYNDMVTCILKFESGMTGKVGCNYSCVYPHFHKLCLYGMEATWENTPEAGLLYESRDPDHPPRRLDSAYPGAAKGDLLRSFIEAVRGQGCAEVTAEDVFETMSVCFAVEAAARHGGSVRVDYI